MFSFILSLSIFFVTSYVFWHVSFPSLSYLRPVFYYISFLLLLWPVFSLSLLFDYSFFSFFILLFFISFVLAAVSYLLPTYSSRFLVSQFVSALFVCSFCFSLRRPGGPWTHKDPPASASRVLGLKGSGYLLSTLSLCLLTLFTFVCYLIFYPSEFPFISFHSHYFSLLLFDLFFISPYFSSCDG